MRKEKQLKTAPIETNQDCGVFYIHNSDERAYREAGKLFTQYAKEFRKQAKNEHLTVALYIERRGDTLYAVCTT